MRRLAPGIAAIALLLPPGQAAGTDPAFETLLEEAAAARTADGTRFGELLERLDSRAGSATPSQRIRLRLLHAHRLAISGDAPGGVAILKPIVDGDADAALRFEAGGLLANIYAVTRRFEDSLQTLGEILPLQREAASKDVVHRVLLNAGIVYNQVGEYGLGMRYATEVAGDGPDGRSRCIAGNLILESRLGLGQDIDDGAARRAIDACEAQNEPILAGFSRTYYARWLHRQGRTREAVRLLLGALRTVERAGYPLLVGSYHALLAEYRMALGDTAAAEAHAGKAVAQTRDVTGAESLVIGYRTLYEIAERRGDPVAALAAHRAFAEADRAHFNDVKSRQMAYQIVRHQSEQQAQQIELLNQKNALLQLEQRVIAQRARAWLALAVLLVFLLATTGYWALKTKRLQLRLKRMAELDELTGIANRHHFAQRAERAIAQCDRERRPLALLTFDLDRFKQINDRYGHPAGDWALRQVADACAGLCGPADAFGRLGGEEFAIVLPGRDAAAARRVAEDALARMSAIDTALHGYGFRLAASFGITDAGLSGYDLTRMLSHADRAMYAAKRGGRNRVCVFGEDNVAALPPSVADAADAAADELARRALA